MTGQLWSWILACVGILGIYLAGRKDPRGWLIGVFAQLLWLAYAISTRQWGFLITAFGYGSIYLKNWIAWRRDLRQNQKEDYLHED